MELENWNPPALAGPLIFSIAQEYFLLYWQPCELKQSAGEPVVFFLPPLSISVIKTK